MARDKRLADALRAVKEMIEMFSDDGQRRKAVEDFERESQLLASLEHPSIPTIYDYFVSEGRYYLVMKFIGGGDLAGKMKTAVGGRLEIQSARLAQGDSLATATGMLALTQRGGLDGNLQLNAANIEKLLPTLTGGKAGPAMALDRAAPALNAIDRAIPGLAARIAPQQQQNRGAGLLALLGKPVEIEGKRGTSLTVKFSDGNASLGPIPLGQVPAAF